MPNIKVCTPTNQNYDLYFKVENLEKYTAVRNKTDNNISYTPLTTNLDLSFKYSLYIAEKDFDTLFLDIPGYYNRTRSIVFPKFITEDKTIFNEHLITRLAINIFHGYEKPDYITLYNWLNYKTYFLYRNISPEYPFIDKPSLTNLSKSSYHGYLSGAYVSSYGVNYSTYSPLALGENCYIYLTNNIILNPNTCKIEGFNIIVHKDHYSYLYNALIKEKERKNKDFKVYSYDDYCLLSRSCPFAIACFDIMTNKLRNNYELCNKIDNISARNNLVLEILESMYGCK